MQEIKFRAWYTKEQAMLTVTYLDWMREASTGKTTERSEGFFGDNHRRKFSLDEVDIMQYTGLKDKNGKKIYRGDIVETFLYYSDGITVYRQNKGIVTYGQFTTTGDGQGYGNDTVIGYYIKPLEDRINDNISIANWDSIEVIGNIYQHPELLKTKN